MQPETDTMMQKASFRDYFSTPRMLFCTIVVIYLIFGATILHILEYGPSQGPVKAKLTKQQVAAAAKKQNELRKLVDKLWDDSQNEEISEENWKINTKQIIEKIDSDNDNDNDDDDDDGLSWTYTQSFLYIVGSLTRIGSTAQPETFFGRFFVLVYTFFGIPLLLIFFADLGRIFVDLLQSISEKVQQKLNANLISSIYGKSGEINSLAFVAACALLLGSYTVIVSLIFRIWCGGGVFSNIYTGFLIILGVGGITSMIPATLLAISAPIVWSLTNMQTDLLGTEYIRKIHVLLKKFKRE